MAASEEFVDATVANLKVIGMVSQNGRLCVRKGQLCLECCGSVQGMRRWLHGDSRDLTLVHVRNAISNARRVVMLSAGCVWTIRRIASELERCEVGLQNLRATYMSDSVMMANLGVVIERIVSYRAQLMRDHGQQPHEGECGEEPFIPPPPPLMGHAPSRSPSPSPSPAQSQQDALPYPAAKQPDNANSSDSNTNSSDNTNSTNISDNNNSTNNNNMGCSKRSERKGGCGGNNNNNNSNTRVCQ
jgi:hypothetical protein